MTIAAASAALEAGDLDAALVALLDAWRAHRVAAIADAIDRVSNEITAKLPPIEAKTVAARTKAWHAIAARRDARDVGRLLAVPWPRTIRALWPVIDEVLAWDDDPRLATALERYVADRELPTNYGQIKERAALLRIATLRDTRVLPRLRVQRDRLPGWRDLIDQAIEALVVASEVASDPAVVEAVARLPIGGARDQGLLAAILEAPHDPAPFAVYGDWLSERGDPRGEFIALQLAGGDTASRERELLAAHGKRWAGGLDRWFAEEPRYFERGFFAGGRLVAKGASTDALFADPMWRLVNVIELDASTIQLLDRPELAHVRVVGPLDPATADRLANGPLRPIEELYVALDGTALSDDLARAPALPKLRVLGLRGVAPNFVDWLASAPIVERVEKIVLTSTAPAVFEALASRGGALRAIEVGWTGERLRGTMDWDLRLAREEGGARFRAVTATRREGGRTAVLPQMLDRLPSDLPASLVVDAPRAMLTIYERAAFDTSVKRLGLVDVKVPWEHTDRAPAYSIPIALETTSLMTTETFPKVWDILARAGQRYDAFTVNNSRTLRPLGKKPLERVLDWIGRTMTAGSVVNNAGSERVASTFQTVVDLVPYGRTIDEQVATFHELVALADCSGTMGGLGNHLFLGPYVREPAAAWIMAMDRELSWQIDRAKIRAFAVDDIAGRLVIRVTRDRDDATVERLRDLANEMAAEIHRNFVARNGYDYVAALHAALGPVAAKYEISAQASRSLAINFRGRRSRVGIDTKLVNAQVPMLEIYANFDKRTDPIANLPVGTAAELARVLDFAARTIDAWFADRLGR